MKITLILYCVFILLLISDIGAYFTIAFNPIGYTAALGIFINSIIRFIFLLSLIFIRIKLECKDELIRFLYIPLIYVFFWYLISNSFLETFLFIGGVTLWIILALFGIFRAINCFKVIKSKK